MKIKYKSIWQILNTANEIEDKYLVIERVIDGLIGLSLKENREEDKLNKKCKKCGGRRIRIGGGGMACYECEIPKMINKKINKKK